VITIRVLPLYLVCLDEGLASQHDSHKGDHRAGGPEGCYVIFDLWGFVGEQVEVEGNGNAKISFEMAGQRSSEDSEYEDETSMKENLNEALNVLFNKRARRFCWKME